MTESHGPGLSQHHVVILLVELLLDVGDALTLIGGGGSPPEEVFWEGFMLLFHRIPHLFS